MKIFINASELAIITRDNRFQYLSDYIIKLYEKYYFQDSQRIQNIINDKTLKITKSENAIDCIKRIVETNDININANLKKCLNSKNVNDLQKAKKEIKEVIEKKNIVKQDKALLDTAITQLTNTNFGTKNENPVLKYYESLIDKKISLTNNYFNYLIKETSNQYYLGGKVDGVLQDNDDITVIEIKNRMKKLFKSLRSYEKVQVYAYMKLLSCNKCRLIECLKTKEYNETNFNVINVEYSEEYYKKILKKVDTFINLFEKIINSDELKIKLYTLEKDELEKLLHLESS